MYPATRFVLQHKVPGGKISCRAGRFDASGGPRDTATDASVGSADGARAERVATVLLLVYPVPNLIILKGKKKKGAKPRAKVMECRTSQDDD